MQGGHSGGDIGKGRGNSSVILGRLLSLLCADDTARVAWFQSGDAAQTNKHGIPAESTLCVCTKDADGVKEQVRTFEKVLRDELSDVDDGVTLCVMEEKSRSQRVLSPESTAALRQLLAVLPNGVQTMQRAFPDTPECSCNLGNVELEDDTVSCYVSVRSCKTTLIDMVCERYEAIAQLVRRLPLALKDLVPINSAASTSIGSRKTSLPPKTTRKRAPGVSLSSTMLLRGFSPMKRCFLALGSKAKRLI